MPMEERAWSPKGLSDCCGSEKVSVVRSCERARCKKLTSIEVRVECPPVAPTEAGKLGVSPLPAPGPGLPALLDKVASPAVPILRCTDERFVTPPGGDPSFLSAVVVGGTILLARCERCFEYLLLDAANPLGFHQNQYTSPSAAAIAATPPKAPPTLVPMLEPPEEEEEEVES